MISLDEARRIVVEELGPTGAESVPLADAFGRTLAAPLIATRTQPAFRSSAMDGYAVRSADLGASATTLKIAGESAAGHGFSETLNPGQAVKISTGAPMPEGADQVVMREDATLRGGDVVLNARPTPGKHVRAAGVDFAKGAELVAAGTRLSPEAVSIAASAGHVVLSVHQRPKIAVLSSGDELVEPGEAVAEAGIINSNAIGLSALIRAEGASSDYLGIARDNPADVRAKLQSAAGADLLVTIGGASVGDHDHLRAVFSELGGSMIFEKIAVKPGKPTWFGHLGGTPVLGLPGNPVSALVMARLILSPALHALLGASEPARMRFSRAILSESLTENGRRETYLRARFTSADGALSAAPLSNQDSSALSALVAADCLVRRAANAPAAAIGETVEILALRTRE